MIFHKILISQTTNTSSTSQAGTDISSPNWGQFAWSNIFRLLGSLEMCIREIAGLLLLCYKKSSYYSIHLWLQNLFHAPLCLCFRAPWFCKESERQLPGYRRVSGPPLLVSPHYITHIYCHCRWLCLFTLALSHSAAPAIHIKAALPGCLCVHNIKSLRINSASIQLYMHDTQSSGSTQRPARTYLFAYGCTCSRVTIFNNNLQPSVPPPPPNTGVIGT